MFRFLKQSRVLSFLAYVTQPYRWYVAGMAFSVFILACDASVKPYLVKCLVDGITALTTWYDLLPLLYMYAFLQVCLIGADALHDWSFARFCAWGQCRGNDLFVDRLTAYSYSFFQNTQAGSIYAKIHDVFDRFPELVYNILHQCIYFCIMVLTALFFLGRIHVLFVVALMFWFVIFALGLYLGVSWGGRLFSCSVEKSRIGGHMIDYLTNIINVKCFVTADYEQTRIQKLYEDYIQRTMRGFAFWRKYYVCKRTFFSFYIMSLVIGLMYLRLQGIISPGDCAMVFMINMHVMNKSYDLAFQLRVIIKNWGNIDEALKLLEQPIDVADLPHARQLSVQKGSIVFEHVQFHYQDVRTLFQNISLTIPGGQRVGFVGYSGSGKTTCAHLILRLFNVTHGRILIDNQDIAQVTQDSLRSMIGMIPQDPLLFHRTIMENIRYGSVNASDDEVIQAAREAYAHDFITGLPKGYLSWVGERGVKLSGGQRQRIAIARALLKNAPILILDEATSQLDSIVEGHIQESLWSLMQGKTTIVIAHRLSTLLRMDRILVFDGGCIVQDGTHAQLLAQDGLYKTMWHAQVGGFLPDDKELQ